MEACAGIHRATHGMKAEARLLPVPLYAVVCHHHLHLCVHARIADSMTRYGPNAPVIVPNLVQCGSVAQESPHLA
jgi:hypothetical protein